MKNLLTDDTELMLFGFRFLRQVLFGEESIPLNDEAAKARAEKVREKRMQEERAAAERLEREEDNDYPVDDED